MDGLEGVSNLHRLSNVSLNPLTYPMEDAKFALQYTLFLFTKFGYPEPWSSKEVLAYNAQYRKEVETPGLHAYYLKRRVWGQKPLDA